MNIKVYGAGSIGNHLTQAARRMGWLVTVVDPDPEALRRMREEIYPERYGAWDEEITQCELKDDPVGFDGVFIGTPPDKRMDVALHVLDTEENLKVLLLEKPLCGPGDERLQEVADRVAKQGVFGFVGYDHAVADSIEFVRDMLQKGSLGTLTALDVEFRQHWEGIFQVHPWLSGPQDSYLGYTERGGGASGEHSHALHLWHTLAEAAGNNDIALMNSWYRWVGENDALYDDTAFFTLDGMGAEQEIDLLGRVVQDVVTKPERRWAAIQGTQGQLEWWCNGGPNGEDKVIVRRDDGSEATKLFPKKRPDDFFAEMRHIDDVVRGEIPHPESPIRLETGVAVMRQLTQAYEKLA